MDVLDAASSSSSRQSSSSPGDYPSRSSTPSQSSVSSDFLSSDSTPLTPWTPYTKHSTVSLLDEDRKPALDPYYSLGMLNNTSTLQTTPPRGFLLEDLMQEDAYENGPLDALLQHSAPSTLIPSFDPSLPELPSYPSPMSSTSTSEDSSHPPTVQLSPAHETVGEAGGSLQPTVTTEADAFESSSLQKLLVTAPNASCPNTPIVTPSRHAIGNLPILIHNVPAVGAKSRVETQIKMTLDLAIPRDSGAGWERVGSWKWLRLPKGTSTRRRPRKEPKIDAHPDDTIVLSVAVTCASNPSMPVTACTNCLAREAKRVERKKAARVRPQRHDSSDSDEEGAVFRVSTNADGKAFPPRDGGNSGIVVFNCPDVNDFSEGRVVLPVRVTCYCRHHREKIGFRIAFTMADSHGRVIGRGSTPPIMITDDHKSVVKPAPPPPEEEEPPSQPKRNKRRLGTKDSDAADADREPRAKRRVKEATPPTTASSSNGGNQQGSGTQFFSQQYHRRFESSPRFTHASAHPSQSPSAFTTAPSSPVVNALNIPSPAASSAGVFLHYPITNDVQPPPPPVVDSFIEIERPGTLTTSLPAGIAVPAPNSPEAPAPAGTVDPLFSALTFQPAPPDGPPTAPPPQIHRLIPASGPTHGGIEVTVLGINFLPTHRCVFGDTAASTQMWSDSTLVCVLPPSATPGPVVVSFEGVALAVGGAPDGRGLQLFNYLDNSDRALMELALQLVGLKMTGRIEEAKDVAMRIVGTSSPGASGDAVPTSGFNGLSVSMVDDDIVHSALHGQGGRSDTRPLSASSTRDFQSVIIEFLKLLEVDVPTTSSVTIREAISHTSLSGQTLLHLSAILGFHRLLKHLITLEIDLDVRDANGYTALHFAALCGRVACARILVEGGADIEIVDARGRLAREIAQWRDQIDVQELLEGHERRLMPATDDILSRDSDDADESAAEAADDAESKEDLDELKDIAAPTATIKPTPVEVPDPILLAAFLPDSKTSGTQSLDEKKSLSEKSLPDAPEKNPQSLLHRTLSQLPTPGLPAFPPMPDFLPNMPGFPMPQWGLGLPNQLQFPALHFPDIPLVFPVQVPTPSWPAALQWPGTGDNGEKRPQGSYPIPSGTSPSWLGLYPGWFAANPVEKEQGPPMYTPPAPSTSQSPPAVQPSPVAESPTQTLGRAPQPPSASETGGATTPTVRSTAALRSRSTRRQTHAAERDVRAHSSQGKKKPLEQSTKSDLMLFFFWIPILIAVLLYGVYVGIPIAWIGIHEAFAYCLPLLQGRLTA